MHLDTLAYSHRLKDLPPQQRLGFGLVMLGFALFSHWPVQGLIGAWLLVWTVGYARIPLRLYGELWGPVIGFLLIGLVTVVVNGVSLNNATTVIMDVWLGWPVGSWYLYLSQAGLIQAWIIFWRVFASMSACLFICCTVPMTQLIGVCREWWVPGLVTDLMLLIYRFIFIVLAQYQSLTQAQAARLSHSSWWSQWRSLKLLGGQLLVRSLQDYQRFRLGLVSRGFTGDLRFDVDRVWQPSWRYGLESVVGGVVLVGLELGLRQRGWH